MKTNCVTAREKLREKTGMTLTEMLVALAILMIAIMCFLPLAQSSFNNIYTVGEKTKSNYKAVGLIERLIGNSGANGAYETQTDNVPLQMRVKSIALQATTDSITGQTQSINGASIVSKPENVASAFSTFICDSVTAKMVCYPSHISDDFLTKTITLYAAGFRFSDISEFQISYTDNTGTLQTVPGGTYNDSNPYCRIKIDRDNASIAYLTLVGDNNIIRFENSPLQIKYRTHKLTVEIDAPTVIMVGEQAGDGNYYYYVTSGEPDEDGNLDIIRKKMNSVDPLGKISGNITLNSAMNDVEWVAAGEGDDGNGGTNPYGYYVMCGDNGQIRRFWKNTATGNYGWGGDYTIQHHYYYKDGTTTVTDTRNYGTTVDSSFVYQQNPALGNGICLIDNHTFDSSYNAYIWNIWESLYTQNVFTMNAVSKYPNLEVYTSGNSLYVKDSGTNSKADSYYPYLNAFLARRRGSGLDLDVLLNAAGYSDSDISSGKLKLESSYLPVNYNLNAYNSGIVGGDGTVKRKVSEMTGYGTFNQLDPRVTNYITLTSVDAIKMKNTYSIPEGESKYYPTSSYTLYCGYIPAVMDLWTSKPGENTDHMMAPGRWRATLGIAVNYNGTADEIVHSYPNLVNAEKKVNAVTKRRIKFDGIVWTYGTSGISSSNFSLSGICGPRNYSGTLTENVVQKAVELGVSPEYILQTGKHQENLQTGSETVISLAYLSNPYAFGDKQISYNNFALSPDRYHSATDGAFDWAFSESATIMDTDTIYYEAYNDMTNPGNKDEAVKSMYLSLAVGYYVGGITNDYKENMEKNAVAVSAVLNNGIVYMRAGGEYGGCWKGYALQEESNVFNEFYTNNDYFNERNRDQNNGNNRNVMEQAVSAGYWRDKYHPLFVSLFGGQYVNNTTPSSRVPALTDSWRDVYSYTMSHILSGKKLKAVSWGWLYNGYPQAMWGADDGTLMSWQGDPDPLGKGTKPKLEDQSTLSKLSDQSICAEFQSYKWYKQAIDYDKKFTVTVGVHPKLDYVYSNWVGSMVANSYYLPRNWSGIEDTLNGKWAYGSSDSLSGKGDAEHPVGAFTNAYYDKCSIQLGKTDTLGFISPLDTVEDVAFANETWVACGVQGLANPRYYEGVEFCKEKAVVKKTGSSDEGSWICVRSWYDQSGGTDSGPCDGNSNFVWQAVQISTIKNCNIQQVTYCNGMWYAVGYIDSNDNGQYDYTVASGQQREHAVVFYAVDPAQPCGTDQGWRLSDNGHVGYTQAYANDGSGNYSLMNIDGVNSVASRND